MFAVTETAEEATFGEIRKVVQRYFHTRNEYRLADVSFIF